MTVQRYQIKATFVNNIIELNVTVIVLGHGVCALAHAFGLLRADHSVILIGHSWLEGSNVYCSSVLSDSRVRLCKLPSIDEIIWSLSEFKHRLKKYYSITTHEFCKESEEVFTNWADHFNLDLKCNKGKVTFPQRNLSDVSLSAAETAKMEPRLLKASASDYFDQEAAWDYPSFWRALYSYLRQSDSVCFMEDFTVKRWHKSKKLVKAISLSSKEQMEADAFVLVGGYDMKRQIKQMRVALNIQPVTSYSAQFSKEYLNAKVSKNFHWEKLPLFLNVVGDDMYVSGFRDLIGWRSPRSIKRHACMLKDLHNLFDLKVDKHHPIKYCSALYPSLPSNEPVMGKSTKYENFYVSTSHSNLTPQGICGIAKILPELIQGKQCNKPFIREIKHFV